MNCCAPPTVQRRRDPKRVGCFTHGREMLASPIIGWMSNPRRLRLPENHLNLRIGGRYLLVAGLISASLFAAGVRADIVAASDHVAAAHDQPQTSVDVRRSVTQFEIPNVT